jgi:hypothetical protein
MPAKETLEETPGRDNIPILSKLVQKKVEFMNKLLNKLSLSAVKIDRRHIQIFLTLLVLGLLVLGAGAPGVDGGTGGF